MLNLHRTPPYKTALNAPIVFTHDMQGQDAIEDLGLAPDKPIFAIEPNSKHLVNYAQVTQEQCTEESSPAAPSCNNIPKKISLISRNIVATGAAFILSIVVGIVAFPLSAIHMVSQIYRLISTHVNGGAKKAVIFSLIWPLILIVAVIRVIIHFLLLPLFGVIGAYYVAEGLSNEMKRPKTSDVFSEFIENKKQSPIDPEKNEIHQHGEQTLYSMPTQIINDQEDFSVLRNYKSLEISALHPNHSTQYEHDTTNNIDTVSENSMTHLNLSENKPFQRFCSLITKHLWTPLGLFHSEAPDPSISESDLKKVNAKAKETLKKIAINNQKDTRDAMKYKQNKTRLVKKKKAQFYV